ncbi:virion protein [Glossina pallidipes salivary gland hypertrophy virus]|uniref:Virion protein n=1 Tax=Glossina hytrovirus (isolate Glossina pallidipes/Ethiopia/Seibersdorf/-) TaxID=379529 RepID=A0A0Y0G7I4_GHVS|nr:virion protein [Glossina pallidipes salivary gland hypertrophy virus]
MSYCCVVLILFILFIIIIIAFLRDYVESIINKFIPPTQQPLLQQQHQQQADLISNEKIWTLDNNYLYIIENVRNKYIKIKKENDNAFITQRIASFNFDLIYNEDNFEVLVNHDVLDLNMKNDLLKYIILYDIKQRIALVIILKMADNVSPQIPTTIIDEIDGKLERFNKPFVFTTVVVNGGEYFQGFGNFKKYSVTEIHVKKSQMYKTLSDIEEITYRPIAPPSPIYESTTSDKSLTTIYLPEKNTTVMYNEAANDEAVDILINNKRGTVKKTMQLFNQVKNIII